jgi:periplasmic divalent cation tolerance protein
MTKALIIFVTASNRKEADKIAQALVNEKLAACVSIVPEIYSRYWWKGHIEYDKELWLVIKTTPRRYRRLEKRIGELHSYSIPEILAIPVVSGNPPYLQWMKNALA